MGSWAWGLASRCLGLKGSGAGEGNLGQGARVAARGSLGLRIQGTCRGSLVLRFQGNRSGKSSVFSFHSSRSSGRQGYEGQSALGWEQTEELWPGTLLINMWAGPLWARVGQGNSIWATHIRPNPIWRILTRWCSHSRDNNIGNMGNIWKGEP